MGEKVCTKQKDLNVIFGFIHQDSCLKCHFLIMPTLTTIYVITREMGSKILYFLALVLSCWSFPIPQSV